MSGTLTPILEAAKEVLKSAGLKGMHVDSIAEAAVDANKNLGLSAEDFSKKLQGSLAANLKLKTQKPSFVRVEGKKKGQYRKGWYRVKVSLSGILCARHNMRNRKSMYAHSQDDSKESRICGQDGGLAAHTA